MADSTTLERCPFCGTPGAKVESRGGVTTISCHTCGTRTLSTYGRSELCPFCGTPGTRVESRGGVTLVICHTCGTHRLSPAQLAALAGRTGRP